MIAAIIGFLILAALFTIPPRLFGAVVGLVVGWCTRNRRPP